MFAQCRRLEALAALHSLTPVPPQTANVLELGCGSGVNLIAQAMDFPSARFIGCDYSATAIAAGQELVQALGLENIGLRQADISRLDHSWGKFDYIICHGVYSWVAPDVRRHILKILREHLTPSGIGCVSYNTLPGWHLRRAVRDLVCHHAAAFSDPAEQVAQAREFLAMAAETQSLDTAYGKLMRAEYYLLSILPECYFYHEMLEEHNQPLYFREFADQIREVGLQYVGEADYSHLHSSDLPARAQEFLKGMPLLSREQYVDFLRGTSFRISVVCHAESRVDQRTGYRDLSRFQVALRNDARLVLPDSSSEEPECGQREVQLLVDRCVIPCSDPASMAVIRYLDERRPEFVPMQELCTRARAAVGSLPPLTTSLCVPDVASNDPADHCQRFLWTALAAGAIEAVLSPPRVTGRISPRPVVGTLARFQAQRGNRISNQLRESIGLSNVSCFIASLLDGTRDCNQLTQLLRQAIDAGTVVPGPFDHAENDGKLVEHVLEELLRSAVLIA